MNMSMTPTGARTVELHKLLADWGEGTSHAPMGEGDGAPATSNDATWRHRFFDSLFWTTQGGDFSAVVSASQSVGSTGQYTWSSTQMVADVQSWLDNPDSNFGWLVWVTRPRRNREAIRYRAPTADATHRIQLARGYLPHHALSSAQTAVSQSSRSWVTCDDR
jgi:hypothetical protein